MRKQRSYQRHDAVPSVKPRVLEFTAPTVHQSAQETSEQALSPQVETCIEVLCQKGCLSVRSDIRALEKGEVLPETVGLTRRETRLVLEELREIMAVYGDTCRIE
jgi:hypothetical protein